MFAAVLTVRHDEANPVSARIADGGSTMPGPRSLSFAALSCILVIGCAESSPVSPAPARPTASARSITPSAITWASEITGTTADGAEYGIFVPTGWNGDVVFYAHGIIPPLAPVSLPGPTDWDDAGAIRDALGAAGFAIAYSSFSENGYAIKSGIQRTHQLRGIFTSKVSRPRRSFLVGHSLGAQVVQALAETRPDQYAGALALCGVLGGTRLETDYIANVRTLFDFFYPGVLPGSTMEMPVVITNVTTQIQNPVLAAIGANPTGFAYIASEVNTQLAGINSTELVTSLINALAYQAIGVNDLLERTHGHILFDNNATVYNSLGVSALNGLVNGSVRRYTATDDALDWLANNYEPSGNLQIPMITFHKTRDRLVPFRHEARYLAKVSAAGATANLLQRSQNAYGHCDLGVSAIMSNFQDLVSWVNTGTKPSA
jgi:pimeloyl-ACP methyl ester carboxylesterase